MKRGSLSALIGAVLYLTMLVAAAGALRSLFQWRPVTAGCLPTGDGYLRARLRGENDLDIGWSNADMQCDGGPRPNERGMRVTFVGHAAPKGRDIRLVFGMAASAGATTARNVPTNVTIIFEDEQKLYSTAGDSKCMIDELTVQPIASHDTKSSRRVQARGFCTAPATDLTGSGTLLLDRFDFAGTVDLDDH
jgi:hypothetical protein